jgi:tetratricopeptide (TPR) repeat protein
MRHLAAALPGLLVAFSCLLQPNDALAANAREMFADGNRLFREDLYWAALLRYSQAEEAGMDTPLLHYNSGIAHYRAQQYVRAHESFLKAAREPRLRAISHYNLGLNSYAANDIDDALHWFRKARDQQSNEDVSELAKIAIARLLRESRQQDPVVRMADALEPEKKLFNLALTGRVSFGSDSNAYRSPSEPYIDLSDPNTPAVAPIVQAGTFIPYDFRAKYTVNSFKHEGFFGAYRVNGRFYQDELLKNANEYRHELSFGNEYHKREDSRERKIFSAFTVAQHDEDYFDPDDGTTRSSGGQDISNRMSYLRYGPEIWFRQSFSKFSFGGQLKGWLYNYENVEAVPEYDHEYIRLGLTAQYKFTRKSLLRMVGGVYTRRYGDRPSFELDGQQVLGNPTITYEYLEYGMTARQRVGRSFWFGFGYLRTEREDKYLGYNNYVRDTYDVRFSWHPGRKLRLNASAYHRDYNYENAFAFHNPIAGRKTLETVNGSLFATYALAYDLTLMLQYEYRDIVSNDTRIAYDRAQYVLGIRWDY